MMASAHVLIVEDSPSLSRIYSHYLQSAGYRIEAVETLEECYNFLQHSHTDIILLDIMLPDGNGIEVLKNIKQEKKKTAVIVMTAYGSIQSAIEAMRSGAYDFLLKPFHADRLLMTVASAYECLDLHKANETRPQETGEIHDDAFKEMIGSSPALQDVKETIYKAAGSNAPLFIFGDSGTGKELCARAAHLLSPRSRHPFIAVNCANIPTELMESEIFGHVQGAFTGAASNREGAAEKANGGTLFLDEVTEMSMEVQAKMLRFLQTNTFQRLGSAVLEKVDIRIMCATNKDPLACVAKGNLRDDLYYRLHVIPIYMPRLKERGQDILELGQYYLEKYAQEEKKDFAALGSEVQKLFLSYRWPGNVRELQNIIRQAIVMHNGDVLHLDMLPEDIKHPVASSQIQDICFHQDETEQVYHNRSHDQIVPLARLEESAIRRAIEICDGNVSHAASCLKVSPSTLYRKIQSWSEKNKKQSGSS